LAAPETALDLAGLDELRTGLVGRLEELVASLVEALREDLNDVNGSRRLPSDAGGVARPAQRAARGAR